MKKLDAAILGATGAVGQRFIQLLEHHPWFRVAEVVGNTSAGKRYGDAVRWVLDGHPPVDVANMVIKSLDDALTSPLLFSALPKEAAIEAETRFAQQGHWVCTNASANRMEEDVPLLLPEANADHLALLKVQQAKRGWSGGIIANSNCTAMPVVMALAPLKPFGIRKVHIVSEQAISGAGYPGVASLDIVDNVIPYVSGDEDKLETETLKMLGTLEGERVVMLDAVMSATCTRVPVIDGHVVVVSLELEQRPSLEAVISAWEAFESPESVRGLPSAPAPPLYYLRQIDRPQPRRDRNAGGGMATTIGRLRPCPILGYKFVTLAHNTIRGAAGGSLLNAELMAREGIFADFTV